MSTTIEAGLLERDQLEANFRALTVTLQDDNAMPQLTELERKRILVRMAVINQGIKWLDNLMIEDIVKINVVTLPTSR